MHGLTTNTLKRSFSFGTSLMDVGTPTFSRGFKVSPPKEKIQAPSPKHSAANAQEPQTSSVRSCEAVNEELFCLEELVWSYAGAIPDRLDWSGSPIGGFPMAGFCWCRNDMTFSCMLYGGLGGFCKSDCPCNSLQLTAGCTLL